MEIRFYLPRASTAQHWVLSDGALDDLAEQLPGKPVVLRANVGDSPVGVEFPSGDSRIGRVIAVEREGDRVLCTAEVEPPEALRDYLAEADDRLGINGVGIQKEGRITEVRQLYSVEVVHQREDEA